MTNEFFAAAYLKGLRSTIRLLLAKGLMVEEAEELAQSAWARGWEARGQVKDASRVVNWVNTIAIHKMCTEKRRAKRYEELADSYVCDASPVTAKIDAEKLLEQCSTLDKSLIIHHYAVGFNMDETAQMHGMTCGGARVRVHRAKASLRRFANEQQTAEMAA